ncbi:type IV toxin-antitoxin system AbiEi family antitoxin domain-containing protein [Enterococcus sp. DIV0756]|uniref:type IV toxin-antitoxin system AbiEi family antitoxin domain-containing protein n=1 Tax=Enterococcus sp. DIV0756 TaxID=2774636 RepID=UPI003F228682
MSKRLDDLLKERDGNLSMKEARSRGISASTVQSYVKSGKLIAIERGFYVLDGHGIDELFLQQNRYSRGIFSYETALDIHQLSKNMPSAIHLTFPKGYNVNRKEVQMQNLKLHFVPKAVFELGKMDGLSYQDNPIHLYDKERTLCDIWSPRYDMAYDLKLESLKHYMAREDKDPGKLSLYMEKLPVSKEMRVHVLSLT